MRRAVLVCAALTCGACGLTNFDEPKLASGGSGGTSTGGTSAGGTVSGGSAGMGGVRSFVTGGAPPQGGVSTRGSSGAGIGGDNPGGAAGMPPTDGLLLWLDANDVQGVPGDGVSEWPDRTLLQPYPVEGALAQQPIVVDDGGRRGVAFDGVDDSLRLRNGFADFRAGMTYFAVVRFDSLAAEGSCQPLIQFSNGVSGTVENDDLSIQDDGSGTFFLEVLETYLPSSPSALDIDTRMLLGVRIDPSDPVSAELYRDNVTLTGLIGTYIPRVIPRTQNYLGRGLYTDCTTFHGVMYEVLLYGRSLAPVEVNHVNAYLQQKWQCCGLGP
jgi:hypothetical protein